MIRVELAPEPAGFDAAVRQPGLSAIAELVGEPPLVVRPGPRRAKIAERRELIPSAKFPDFWTGAIKDLLREYHRRCAYICCYIEPVTGTPTVDHMVPKSRAWDRVYEWDNYRLACHLMNTRKNDLASILDPFEVQNNWFELELVDFQVKPRKVFGARLHKRVEDTLRILNQPDCCGLRGGYVEEYWGWHIDLDYLTRRAPFVAMELRRQNRLREGDV